MIPSLRLAPLPLIAAVVSALCLAGALATFLVYPVSAQSENEPLTASFLTDTGPSNHGGAGQTFTIRIRFSEDIATSYRVLRDQALQVEGGVARKFKRVHGSRSLWAIHAKPDSDADVTLTLPATTDCSAAAAVCTASDKPLSERVTTTIPGPAPEPTPEPPDEPTGLTAPTVAHDSVTLGWDDPGDSSITDYQVLRRSRDGDEYGDGQGAAGFVAIVDDTGSSSASYTDTSVTAQTRYVYRVKARNSAGLSPRSGYVNVETSAAPAPLRRDVPSQLRQAVPSQPTGLAASTVLENSVTFAWDDPGDSSVTHYQVLRRVGDSGSFTTIEENTGSADATYTDTTVAADTGYEYRVVAENDNGASPESDSLSVSTPPEATATVVEVLPEEPEEPAIAEEQRAQNLIDRGALAVRARGQVGSFLFGTIESPADRHRYQVELEADKFYKFHICGCYTNETGFSKRQLLLMDSEGNPVQENGKDVVSAPHAKWSGTYIYFAPATGGTYLLDVRASDDQQTGDYALRARDITIAASSDDEGSGSSNDFRWHNVALLHLYELDDDSVNGKINSDGEGRRGVVDQDYFSANLHAGRSYTFRFAASSVSRTGNNPAWLTTWIYGPGNYYKVSFSGNISGGSKTLTTTFTANRTGSYVFQIHLQQATGNYEVRVTEN